MHRICFVGRQSQEHKDTLRYHTWNTEQFSCVCGWNIKNGELSELQMFRTGTKSFSKQISSFFTLEKRQKSDSNAGEEVESP